METNETKIMQVDLSKDNATFDRFSKRVTVFTSTEQIVEFVEKLRKEKTTKPTDNQIQETV